MKKIFLSLVPIFLFSFFPFVFPQKSWADFSTTQACIPAGANRQCDGRYVKNCSFLGCPRGEQDQDCGYCDNSDISRCTSHGGCGVYSVANPVVVSGSCAGVTARSCNVSLRWAHGDTRGAINFIVVYKIDSDSNPWQTITSSDDTRWHYSQGSDFSLNCGKSYKFGLNRPSFEGGLAYQTGWVSGPTCPASISCAVSGSLNAIAGVPTPYTISGANGDWTKLYGFQYPTPNWTSAICQGTSDCIGNITFPSAGSYWVVCDAQKGATFCTGDGYGCGPDSAKKITVTDGSCQMTTSIPSSTSTSCTLSNSIGPSPNQWATGGIIISRSPSGSFWDSASPYSGPLISPWTDNNLSPGSTYYYNVGCWQNQFLDSWGGWHWGSIKGYSGWQRCTLTCTPTASWGSPWDTGVCNPSACGNNRNVTCNATCGGLCDGIYSNGQSKYYDSGGTTCNVTASWTNTGSCGQYSACKQSEICNATCGGICSGGYTNGQIRSVNNCGCTCNVSLSGPASFIVNQPGTINANVTNITGGGTVNQTSWTTNNGTIVTPTTTSTTATPSNPGTVTINGTTTLSPFGTCTPAPATFGPVTVTSSYFQTSGGDVYGRSISNPYIPSGYTVNTGIAEYNSFTPAGHEALLKLTGYSSNTPAVTYAGLLATVAKNAGTSNNFDSICTGPKTDSITLPGYTIYCYVPSGFTSALQAAAASGINIVYPVPSWPSPNLASAVTVNSKTVVFVNGDLSVNANVTVGANGGAVFVTNGNVTVDPAVTRLDGLYIFSGNFNDSASGSQLAGNGSLLGTGTINFSRNYPATSGPAESWTYEPKYLDLFKKILSTASYTWKELPPQ